VNVSRVEIVQNGETIFGFDIAEDEGTGNVRWARTIDVPVTEAGWLMVVVSGSRTVDEVLPGLHVAPFAFTNPIYFDVSEPADEASRKPARTRATPAPFVAEEAPPDDDASFVVDAAASSHAGDAAAAGQPPSAAPVPPDN
jgi:hypothetical protein